MGVKVNIKGRRKKDSACMVDFRNVKNLKISPFLAIIKNQYFHTFRSFGSRLYIKNKKYSVCKCMKV